MGGDIWTLWDLHVDGSRAPRMVSMGRWAERGIGVLIRRSTAHLEHGANRRLVLAVLGAIVALPTGSSSAPVARLEMWTGAFSERAARIAQAVGHERSFEFVRAAGGLFEEVRAAADVPKREAANEPGFAWARQVAPHLPPHARHVTVEEQADGAPAPGSFWWPLSDGWVIVSAQALMDLEQRRSPTPLLAQAGDQDHAENPTRGVLTWRANGNTIGGALVALLAPPRVGLFAAADGPTLQAIGLAPTASA